MSTIQALDLQLKNVGPYILSPVGLDFQMPAPQIKAEPAPEKPKPEPKYTADGKLIPEQDDSLFGALASNLLGLPIGDIHMIISSWEVISEEFLDKRSAAQANLTTQAKPKANEFISSSKALKLNQEDSQQSKKKFSGAIKFH